MFRKTSPLFILLITFGISLFILPSEEEMTLLQKKDTPRTGAASIPPQALKTVSKKLEESKVIPLVDLCLQRGEPDKALDLLNIFLKDQPHNLRGYRYLAKIYKDTENIDLYLETLKKLIFLDSDPHILRELRTFRPLSDGDFSEEKILRRLVDQGDASVEEKMTLVHLYTTQNRPQEAIPLLKELLPSPGDLNAYQPLHWLLKILVRQRDFETLESLSRTYVSKALGKASWPFLETLVAEGQRALALKYARPLGTEAFLSSPLIQWQVDQLIEDKKNNEAFVLLAQSAEKKRLPPSFEPNLLSLALGTQNKDHMLRALPLISDFKSLPASLLLDTAAYLLFKGQIPELTSIQKKLDSAFLKKYSLLKMILSAGKSVPASSISLQDLEILQMASPLLRLRLARRLFSPRAPLGTKAPLLQHFSFTSFKSEDLLEGIEHLVALDLSEKAFPLFLKEFPNLSALPSSHQKAWVFLATSAGVKQKETLSWIEKNLPLLSEQDLLTLFAFSSLHDSLHVLSIFLAETLYYQKQEDTSRLRLVETYLNAKAYAQAEPLLKTLALTQKGPWEEAYISVLTTLGKKADLNYFLASRISSDSVEMKKKREIAFTLLKAGNKKEASKLLAELAHEKPPTHPDVQQLLLLWKKPFPPPMLRWLERRTRRAPLREKADWLKIILNAGESVMVIKFIEDMNLTHRQEITETYLEALEKVKDRRGLKTRLIQGIDQKTNLKELITLFELASSLGNRVLEKQARRKLTKLYPDTPYVLRLSSEKALSKGKYDKAKRLLEKLFSQGQEDPQSLFGYAEIIRHQQGLDKAKIYYEKVIPRLKNISPKKIEFDVLEAKTLYFIGKKEESLSRCKKILSTAQKNKAIRTGMAHFLAEVGELKEAGSMLKG